MSCIFSPLCSYEKTPESGERLECQGFYSSQRIKMSIGLECEAGTIGGIRASDGYDYDADYLDNGMAYIILPETKTEQYVFGIVRIDRVGWDDPNTIAMSGHGLPPTLRMDYELKCTSVQTPCAP